MSAGFTPGLAVSKAIRLRRRRELPLPGKVTVAIGQKVEARQPVARTELPGELRIVRATQDLGIDSSELVEVLKVKVGDAVRAGSILCEHRAFFGLLKNQVLSPISGVIELITEGTGHIGVRAPSVPLELNAYLAGTVVEVLQDKGVVIETDASFVQGIFGVGGERLGKLAVLDIAPGISLRAAHIPPECHGLVLAGGSAPDAEALQCAASRGAVGLVTGSIDDHALKSYLGYDLGMALTGDEDVPMTVIVTEGFGGLPISDRVLAVLRAVNGKPCAINGATQVRAGAVRPEIIVPYQEGTGTRASVDAVDSDLVPGATVRIIRVPYFGRTGEIVELPYAAERIETGAMARVLRVKLGQDVVTVPRANVERIPND